MKRDILEQIEACVDELKRAIVPLVQRVIDEHVAAAVEHVRTGLDRPVPPAKVTSRNARAKRKTSPRRETVSPRAKIIQRDIKPANVPAPAAPAGKRGPTCSKCGTSGHNARTCRGGRGGGIEMGNPDRVAPDHDRRERIAKHSSMSVVASTEAVKIPLAANGRADRFAAIEAAAAARRAQGRAL